MGQWSMVNGQWSMVNGQWSMVNIFVSSKDTIYESGNTAGKKCQCDY
jgi:hypothetical protein